MSDMAYGVSASESKELALRPPTQPTKLRDYFAAQAMQAIISNDAALMRLYEQKGGDPYVNVSEAAYYQADAMLKARVR